MKKILLILLAAVVLSGCYTTLYPPANMDMSAANDIPDSTRQVIVNNYYETTEYYQVPYYHRYSLLWGSYYWDPFYYDYSYYHWRPYYWYGHYYYYNPHNHYWYYYDHHYPWHYGSWDGGSSGGNGDKERIHKPGYSVLTSTPTGSSVPFVSGNSNNSRISKPIKKVGVDLNSGVRDNNEGYYSSSKPRIESVGKKPVGSTSSTTTIGKSTSNNKSNKPSATTTYKPSKQSSSNRSSSSSTKVSKSSNTNSTSSKNSRNESSSSSGKKSN